MLNRVAEVDWYQSIDLGHGVVTPGSVDHRLRLDSFGLPGSLQGMRCLDVATWDGFWAFEMERRGATDVVAVDVGRWSDWDIPAVLAGPLEGAKSDDETGAGFRIAHELLGSGVKREICSVYQLSPDRFGKFDIVIISDLLPHLRDPLRALEQVFSVCRGTLILAEVYNTELEGYGDLCLGQFAPYLPDYTWWLPNSQALAMMMIVAGFEPVEEVSRFPWLARDKHGKISARSEKVVLRGLIPKHRSWNGHRIARPQLNGHRPRRR